MLITLGALLLCVLTVTALQALSVGKPPTWQAETGHSWKTIAWTSWAYSLGYSLIMALLFHSAPAAMRLLLLPGAAASYYVLVQACHTDPLVRKVDRRVMNLASIFAIAGNATFLYLQHNTQMMVLYGLVLLVCFALVLLPLMGASDGRAFLLSAAAYLPLLGLPTFLRGLQIMAALFILYALVASFRHRGEEKWFSVLLTKVSIPAVPLIMTPFALLLPFSSPLFF